MDPLLPKTKQATGMVLEAWLQRLANVLVELETPNPAFGPKIANQLDQLHKEAARYDRSELVGMASEVARSLRAWAAGTNPDPRSFLNPIHRMASAVLDALAQDATQASLQTSQKILRVLIVDDSPISADSLANAATSAGLAVRIATTFKEVKDQMTSFEPNVLISDVRMPNLDVKELCSRFRATVGESTSVVVLISASPETELRDPIEAIKPDGFASKMLGATKVIEAVRSVCAQKLG